MKTNGTKSTAKKQWSNEFPIDPNNQQTRIKGKKKKKPGKKKQKLGHTHKWRNEYTPYYTHEYNRKHIYECKRMVCKICGESKHKGTYQHYIKKGDVFEPISLSLTVDVDVFNYRIRSFINKMLQEYYASEAITYSLPFSRNQDKIYAWNKNTNTGTDMFDIEYFVLSNPRLGFENDLDILNQKLQKIKIDYEKAKDKWYEENEQKLNQWNL